MKRERRKKKKKPSEPPQEPRIEKTPDGGFRMKLNDWRDLRDFMTIAYPSRG